ncbi:MAG: hypothetical protein U1E70_04885 [Acetobacteraceae bacterium]
MLGSLLGRCAGGLLLLLSTGVAGVADTMTLSLRTTGDETATMQTERSQDATHGCALLGPSGAEQTLVLTYNASRQDMLLQPSDFGFSLSIAGRLGTEWTQSQPAAILQVSIGNLVFLGLHASDPAFRLRVTVEAGGAGGTFTAQHLRHDQTGRTIDVTGSWRCASGAAPMMAAADLVPVGSVSPGPVAGDEVANPAGGAKPSAAGGDDHSPAKADESMPLPPPISQQRSFRIFRSTPCSGTECAIWLVTDVRSGRTYAANVDLKSLRLSKAVLSPAHEAQIELWITGEQARGRERPTINAVRLEGIVPRSGEGRP